MRVGILLNDSNPTAGGGYTFQKEVFEAFLGVGTQSRHSFTVLCHPQLATSLVRRPASNIEVIPLELETPARPARLFGRSEPRRCPRTLDEQIEAAGIEFVWLLSAPGQVLQTPYMTIVWDLQHRLQPWFPEVSAGGNWQHRENLYGSVLRRAAAVITGTQIGKMEIERFYQVSPTRILTLALPTPRFALMAAASGAGVPSHYELSGGYVLYPAQFWAHKNHVNLVLAIDLLVNRLNRPVTAVLVGSDQGNLRHVETVVARLGLGKYVRILGFVPQEDLIGLYRNALALAFVTFFGPDNLPPLEAFALGCPVIASDVAGAREQLDDAALFVDPRSPDQIAQAIVRLRDDQELRQRLVEAGRKLAAERTPENFVSGAMAFFDQFEAVRRCWA